MITTQLIILLLLMSMLIIIAITVHRTRSLFAATMLFGMFSLVAALAYVLLDAVDVALTEAAVGAGISTILMLGTLALTHQRMEARHKRHTAALLTVLFTGGVLLWAIPDMPGYGDVAAPIHQHLAPHFLKESGKEIGIPNVVTSILASYRGYDTLGEVIVVFTAGVGVLGLLGPYARRPLKRRED